MSPLVFKYSAFLQNVEIHIESQETPKGLKVLCRAQVQLPILKKKFSTWTLFENSQLNWIHHSPVCEEGLQTMTIHKDQCASDTTDPIGLFLKIHANQWYADQVKLLIGKREVVLKVERQPNTTIVSRPEKNQKLIIKTGEDGVEALEVPIPILGTLKIKRIMHPLAQNRTQD